MDINNTKPEYIGFMDLTEGSKSEIFRRCDSRASTEYIKTVHYIKTDESRIINETCIKWVKKIDECLEVCMKGNGCYIGDTHKICKMNNPKSYELLIKYFE
jgi:predicted nucleic acid-binding Zn ribbon protein